MTTCSAQCLTWSHSLSSTRSPSTRYTGGRPLLLLVLLLLLPRLVHPRMWRRQHQGCRRLAMAPLTSLKQSSPEAMGSPSLSWRRVKRVIRLTAPPADSLTA